MCQKNFYDKEGDLNETIHKQNFKGTTLHGNVTVDGGVREWCQDGTP